MPNVCARAGIPRLFVLTLSVVIALAMSGGASAEFPYMNYGPSILGTPQEGQTLQGQTGQWLYLTGLKCESSECTYSYTWQRCNPDTSGCVDVPGATGFSYTLTAADVGKRIRFVEWIFKRDCGATNTQTGLTECRDITKNGVSTLTSLVTPKPVTTAQSSAPPTIQGVAMEDEVLRATGGTWSGPGTITKAIYWQRCNAAGEACATMIGATGPTYKLTSTDVGSRVRVVETATNEGGTAQAVSTPTAVVVELRPTAFRPAIAVARVTLPHRLVLNEIVTQQSGRTVTVKVRVSDDRGFQITGVLVKATPTALLSGSSAERTSDNSGWATFRYTATGSGTAFLYVEAHRRGERAQSGISTANLFRIRVRG